MKNVYVISLFIVLLSCGMPSNKKNPVIISEKEVVKEESLSNIPRNQKLNSLQQINSAILSAPIEAREGAKVYGYNENGDFITLREGSNSFICIADNPSKDGFQVVCYHSSLEPIMSRGRELTKDGKSRGEKE